MYFVWFHNIYGFIKITGKVFLSELSGSSAHLSNALIIAILYSPAIGMYMYMLIRWILELLEKRFLRALQSGFWVLQVVAFLFFIIGLKLRMDGSTSHLTGQFIAMRDIILIPMVYLPLIYIFPAAKSHRTAWQKKLVLILGGYYLITFSILFTAYLVYFPFYSNINIFYGITAFIHFFMHIPVLLYLHKYLLKYKDELEPHIKQERIDLFSSRYSITNREKEIIILILKGRTNAQIGRELFVATKTVKNNVFNIYRKTGVKNRVQLLNLVQNNN